MLSANSVGLFVVIIATIKSCSVLFRYCGKSTIVKMTDSAYFM